MNLFLDYYNIVLANPALKGLVLVALSIAVAKLVDLIFTFIFKKLVDKTKTSFDDQILQLLHKPIFYSILFIGFTIAVKTAILPDYIDFALIGIFKTITIFIWIFYGRRPFGLYYRVDYYSSPRINTPTRKLF